MRTRTLILLLAFLGLPFFCGLAFFALTTTRPQKSPTPWPGATTHIGEWVAIGSFGHARDTTYTSEATVEDIRQYYDLEMAQYCRDLSSWEERDEDGRRCICRDCDIVRGDDVEQWFKVNMCDQGDHHVGVTQTDVLED